MRPSRLKTMDLSQTAGQVGGLRGELPPMASHGTALEHLMLSHQSLEGFVPPLRGTLSILALQGLGARLRGRPTTHAFKKGSKKGVSQKGFAEGSQKGS